MARDGPAAEARLVERVQVVEDGICMISGEIACVVGFEIAGITLQIARVGRVLQGLPYEGQVSFSTSTKAFRDYVRSVASQAQVLKTTQLHNHNRRLAVHPFVHVVT